MIRLGTKKSYPFFVSPNLCGARRCGRSTWMIQPSGCFFLLTSIPQDWGGGNPHHIERACPAFGVVDAGASSQGRRLATLPFRSTRSTETRLVVRSGPAKTGLAMWFQERKPSHTNQSGVCLDRTASCYVSSGFSSAAYPPCSSAVGYPQGLWVRNLETL